jgi:hypothetical protein
MLWLLWLLFALIFFLLTIFHVYESTRSIPHFRLKDRPGADIGSMTILGADIDEPARQFQDELNSFLDEYNGASRKQNLLQAFGYILAVITSVVSMILELLATPR